MYRENKEAFTLIEIMVVILIIAVLSAVAWPQYKHAVLKSRFSTVMPIAKAVKEGQEVYYLSNNRYAQDKEDLDIALVEAENTQVELSSEDEEDRYRYVAAKRTDIPEVRYIMYQKNSPKFAENIHCEAKVDNDDGLWLCEKGLRGVEVTGSGSLRGGEYKTFLLEGNQGESTFITCPEGASCDEEGNITECGSGYYQEEQSCKQEKTCDNATKPTTEQICSSGCGRQTREVSCDYTTGTWVEEEWQGACAGAKPDDYTSDCATGQTGITTYTYVCDSSNQWKEQIQSTCTTLYSGNTPSNFCKSKQSADGCSGSTFEDEAQCWAFSEGGCSNSTFKDGTMCWSIVSGGCNGATFESGSDCQADTVDSCAGTYKSGSHCTATVTGACGSSGTVYELGATCIPDSGSGSFCAKGTPANSNHTQCWDGNGHRGAEYCNN